MAEVRKAVITAAGRGTRMYPATATIQKEMLPLVDRDGLAKPTIQIILEEALEAGIQKVCLVVNRQNRAQIEAHFRAIHPTERHRYAGKKWALDQSERLADMGRRITYVEQESQEGYGHAVWMAREFVGRDPFLLLLGDHVYTSKTESNCARQVVSIFERFGANLSSVRRTPAKHLHLYGTVRGAPVEDAQGVYEVEEMVEKPSVEYAACHLRVSGLEPDAYLCFFGMHVFGPEIMDILSEMIARDERERGEFQLTGAQDRLRERGFPYLACEVSGERYDVGIPEGYVEAQLALALKSPYRANLLSQVDRLVRP